jgi:hypothetical protein
MSEYANYEAACVNGLFFLGMILIDKVKLFFYLK